MATIFGALILLLVPALIVGGLASRSRRQRDLQELANAICEQTKMVEWIASRLPDAPPQAERRREPFQPLLAGLEFPGERDFAISSGTDPGVALIYLARTYLKRLSPSSAVMSKRIRPIWDVEGFDDWGVPGREVRTSSWSDLEPKERTAFARERIVN